MTNESRANRTTQAGLHENPDFILQYLQEIELLAEEVLAERRDIIELNKRRDKLREANRCDRLFISFIVVDFEHFRAIQKQPNNIRNNWMCVNNSFIGLPTNDCKQLIDRGENGLFFVFNFANRLSSLCFQRF